MRPDDLHPLVVGPVGAEQGLDRQRAGRVRGLDQHVGIMHREREQRLHGLGAVDQRQALLGSEGQRLEPALGQHLGGWAAPRRVAGPAQPPLADQRLGQVGELGQVAGGPDGALARDHRQQIERQQLEQPGGQVDPYPGVAGRERPGPQQQHGPHRLIVERNAGRGRVRADDRALQGGQVRLPHRRVGQRAEPGVDPVHRRVPAQRPHDDRAADLHPLRHAVAEPGPHLTARHRDDVLHGQRASVHHKFPHGRQLPTPGFRP